MATMQIDLRQSGALCDGGYFTYEAEGLKLSDVIITALLFILAAIQAKMSEGIVYQSAAINRQTYNGRVVRKPNATPGRIGWVWFRVYVSEIFGGGHEAAS